jgi:hypothetical protein
MLNLKELEKEIDEALERETKESLTEWLMSMRFPSIETFFGAGSLVNLDELSYCTKLAPSKETNLPGESIVSEDNCLQMAA